MRLCCSVVWPTRGRDLNCPIRCHTLISFTCWWWPVVCIFICLYFLFPYFYISILFLYLCWLLVVDYTVYCKTNNIFQSEDGVCLSDFPMVVICTTWLDQAINPGLSFLSYKKNKKRLCCCKTMQLCLLLWWKVVHILVQTLAVVGNTVWMSPRLGLVLIQCNGYMLIQSYEAGVNMTS